MTNRSETPRTEAYFQSLLEGADGEPGVWQSIARLMFAYAKDLEEELTAAQALAERRWIPVTKRLPENDTTVLVLLNGGSVLVADRFEQQWIDDYTSYPLSNSTHWMPIPEPPAIDRAREGEK